MIRVFFLSLLLMVLPARQPSPESIVIAERAKWTTAQLQAPENIVSFLRGLARRLNAAGIADGPFGLLVKESGHACDGYACDIICSHQGSEQRQWDVLGDAQGASVPGWREASPIVVRHCEIEGAGPAPTPIPLPSDPALEMRVKTLEAQIAILTSALADARQKQANDGADVRTVIAAESAAIRALIQALPAPAIPCTSLPDYKGRSWFGSITSKPQC